MSAQRAMGLLRASMSMLAAALLLCVAAAWNGQAFFYPDTPAYVRGAEMGVSRLLGAAHLKPWQSAIRPTGQAAAAPSHASAPATGNGQDKVVMAGRSVYYGALLYLSYQLGGMWFAVAVQALCVAYLLHLLAVRLWGLRGSHLVGMVAALALLTPLGVYTSLVMPDVFAPMALVAGGLLAVYWDRLGRGDRLAVAAILVFSLVIHASHLALAVLMLALALVARMVMRHWRGLPKAGLVVLAACIVMAAAAEWAFNKATAAALGSPPLRYPHLTGHLIDMGPGTDFLRKRCPQAGYAACAYVHIYPTNWVDFLFSTDPAKGTFAVADAATRRRLSSEQVRFALDVLKHDPAGVIGGLAAEVAHQLGNFGVAIWTYAPEGIGVYEPQVPPDILADMQRSRAARASPFDGWLTIATYTTVLASAAVGLLWWWRRRERAVAWTPPSRFAQFAEFAVAGVLANAVVCAVLASSLDRFQARVVWLLPFLALTAHALARQAQPRVSPGSDSSIQGQTP